MSTRSSGPRTWLGFTSPARSGNPKVCVLAGGLSQSLRMTKLGTIIPFSASCVGSHGAWIAWWMDSTLPVVLMVNSCLQSWQHLQENHFSLSGSSLRSGETGNGTSAPFAFINAHGMVKRFATGVAQCHSLMTLEISTGILKPALGMDTTLIWSSSWLSAYLQLVFVSCPDSFVSFYTLAPNDFFQPVQIIDLIFAVLTNKALSLGFVISIRVWSAGAWCT